MKTDDEIIQEYRERMEDPRISSITVVLDDAPQERPETFTDPRNLTVDGLVVEFDYEYFCQWVHVKLIGRIIKQIDYIEPEKKPDNDNEED